MIFLSMVAALALEHWRYMLRPFSHYVYFADWCALLRRQFDGGETFHGAVAWVLAVFPVILSVWLVQAWLTGWWSLLGWAWNVLVLYFTMGFKYYTEHGSDIASDLRAGRMVQAYDRLAEWREGEIQPDREDGEAAVGLIASMTIERLFDHSLRQTFGVLFWFACLGPAGAVLYRSASILSRKWADASPSFHEVAAQIFHVLNWLPSRLTALTYAVAGNFEEAIYGWRSQSGEWPDCEEGIAIGAGAGAMGVRLGHAFHMNGELVQRPEIGVGDEPGPDQIDSAISMIWRGLMVWLVAGLLLTISGWAN